ncbi:MAG: hypothetical protein A2Z71_10350 [Chloroflexi bacterium RBG_13_50_21]|nr:MAG: hypothetical protein A2Z71_10350 [Chloroflexi bacterium RBG_13_50_21]
MIDQVSETQVYTYNKQLAGELPVWVDGAWYTITSRNTNSGTPIQKATHYMGERMAADGLDVEYHVWNNATNPNVIGEIPGLVNPDDIFIIGAHLDDVSNTPGADDNASGSVATLIAADILAQYQWGCTLRFAFWTGEEQALLGSEAYAQEAFSDGENILGYLNLDMIAWNTPLSSPDIDLIYNSSMPATLQLAQLFADVVSTYDINLIPGLGISLGGGSDHSSFWDYGYTAILAIEDQGDFNPSYHGPGDTPAHNNLGYFTDFVKASIGTYAHMSDCLIPSGLGYLDGNVTAASDGEFIQGATVTADNGAGHSYPATTDVTGYYTRTLMADTYTVTASAYGYNPVTMSGIVVTTDTVITQDFALTALPIYTVSGHVYDAVTGDPLEDAIVGFTDAPVPTDTTDASGFYSLSVAEGIWHLQAQADLHTPQTQEVIVNDDLLVDFDLDPHPCILLVDDDNNDPDTTPYYTAALDTLGYEYNVFDVGVSGANGPDLAGLQGYRMVLWYSGDKYGSSAGPNATDEATLTSYLNSGGKLFLDSQDYLYDFDLTPFGQNFLGIASFTDDIGYATTKYGVTGDPIGNGLVPYTLTYPSGFRDYGDIVNQGTGASVAFRSAAGGGGNKLDVDKDGGAWQTVFFGTSWVPIYNNNATNGQTVLQRVVDFFGGCQPPAVSITPAEQTLVGEVGTQVSFVYTVTNEAVVPQAVQLSVEALWPTQVPASTGVLAAGASTTVPVTVTVPLVPDAIIAEDSFTLTAMGVVGGNDTATGTTMANVTPGGEVVAPQDGSGMPLDALTYEFVVTNTGNYTDSFALAVSGVWTASLPGGENTEPLAAGAGITVTVLVEIPEGVSDGDIDVTTLKITSILDSAEYALADVTTTAIVRYYTLLPLIRR